MLRRIGALLLAVALGLIPVPARAELIGSVSGTITAAGSPVPNAWVSFIPLSWRGERAGQGASVVTDAQGRYLFPDLYVDHIKIQVRAPASGGLATTYWPDAFTLAEAGVLRVTSSGVTADVDLPPGGSVRGQVVDAETGRPVAGARVAAYAGPAAAPEQVGVPAFVSGAGPDGFAIDDLPPVGVALRVAPPASGVHLGGWHDGADSFEAASRIDGSSATEGLRITLRAGAAIRGTVTDDAGEPVAGASVEVTGCDPCPPAATTSASGRYRIGAIPPGSGLRVRAEHPEAALMPAWREPGRAALTLPAGRTERGVDITMARGAIVDVQVRDNATGRLLPRSTASLLPVAGGGRPIGPQSRDPSEAPAGTTVRIGPVPPGDYRLEVDPGLANPGYTPVTWAESSGVGPSGRLALAPGERAEVSVSLAAADPPEPVEPTTGAPGRTCGGGPVDSAGDGPAASEAPAAPDGWPGLPAGFLAPAPPWA